MNEVERVARDFTSKDRSALSRVLSWIELSDQRFEMFQIQMKNYPSKHAHVVGVTGPPGAGKSTMVDSLLARWDSKMEVGVLAIDPSNERSMGGFLADRARFDHGNYRAFMRSIGSRGGQGGLYGRTAQMIRVMDLFGFDIIILETVGSGQSDVAVSHLADTTVLLEVPGMGDSLQADKAGILDFADIIVVNKADLAGADTVYQNLKIRLRFSTPKVWATRLLKCSINDAESLDELCNAIAAHQVFLTSDKAAEEIRIDKFRLRFRDEFVSNIQELAGQFFDRHVDVTNILSVINQGPLHYLELLKSLEREFCGRSGRTD